MAVIPEVTAPVVPEVTAQSRTEATTIITPRVPPQ